MTVRILRRMVHSTLFILLGFAALPLLAQEGTTMSSTNVDSLQRVQDSVYYAASIAIARDSTQLDEYQKIIAIYKARKRFDEELKIAQQMVAANPAAPTAYFAVGDAQLDNGAPELAIEPLGKALIIEPAFVRVRVVLAEAYAMLKSFDTALCHLDTAITFNPRYAQAHMQKAALLTQLGRDSEAVESYRAAAELLPDSFNPWMKLARGLFKAGRFEEAIDAVQYATTLNTNSSDALYLYAETCEQLGRITDAIAAYENFMLRFPTDRRALDAERAARELAGRP
jgi:tetratricopeptide (TPR) repeat protein